MTRFHFLLILLVAALTLGCTQQKAAEPQTSDQQQAQDQNQTTAEEREESRSAGEKLGETAREAEVRTRDERAKVKEGARELGQKIKEGSKELYERTTAAAAGVKEGWSKDGKFLNVNTASAEALDSLDPLTQEDAARIVANRPYPAKEDLLNRKILSAAKYNAVAERLVVK